MSQLNILPQEFDEQPEVRQPARKLRVGITQGDTNGVGYELIYKTFADAEMFDLCTPIVYGHIKAAAYHKKALESPISVHIINDVKDATPDRLNLVNLSTDDVNIVFGEVSAEAGRAAFASLERATADLKAGRIDVLVTAPICKAAIKSEQFPFHGHTEYLAECLGTESESQPLMLMISPLMRVALLTTHIPIAEVPFQVTKPNIERHVQLLLRTLRRDFALSAPRVAILSLNPHAGENGILGHEEKEVIVPTVNEMLEVNTPCFGPYAADAFFGQGLYRSFDAVLGIYHDQVLTPFKALSMSEGVNYTAGLPYVRTSPDHGTAFDIAGQGLADPSSFRAAIFAAIDIFRAREAFDEASANPLPKLFKDRREGREVRN